MKLFTKKHYMIFMLAFLLNQYLNAEATRKVTVYVEPVTIQPLSNTITYGGRISPINIFPQMANYSGIIRSIAVEVGQSVKAGDRLYSVQQTTPGAQFIAGWVYALNPGVVAAVSADEGEQVNTGQAVVTIADTASFRIDFYMNDRDVTKIKHLDNVYLKNISKNLSEAEDKLTNLIRNKSSVEEVGQQLIQITALEELKKSTTGRVTLLPIVPDLRTGLFKVRAEFNYNDIMSIGHFQLIELAVDRYTGIAISQSAITKRYGRDNVTIIRNGKVEYQAVEVGKNYGRMVSIISGLNIGDEIVIGSNGRYKLGDEVDVEIRSPKQDIQFRKKLALNTMQTEIGIYPSKELWQKPYLLQTNYSLLQASREELGIYIKEKPKQSESSSSSNTNNQNNRVIAKYKKSQEVN